MMGEMLLRPVGHFYSFLSYYLKMVLKQWKQRAGGGGGLHKVEFIIYYLSPNNFRVLSQLNKNRLNKKCIQLVIQKFLRENTIWASPE
jgi:hypothetical protein